MEMWKICRVLNNPIRFALLREIMVSPGRVQNVVQAGERLGIKKSLASQYLKKLSEAGLLMVKRSGRYAMCSSVNLQRSSVARLQIALDEFFRGKHSASDDETVLKTLNALSHHGRIAILRIVADQAGLSFSELEKATGFPAATLRRQLGVLIEAGVIATSENAAGSRTYLLGRQSVNLSFVLVSLALDGRLKP